MSDTAVNNLRPIRVLHLDDSARDAELIQNTLRAHGLSCEVVWVNGRESFESALAGQSFDLVIADYKLPDYDGMSALARVREQHLELPVILISGKVSEEKAVECLKAGADDYVLKQRLQRLGSAVTRALREAEERQQRRRAEVALRESEVHFRSLAEVSPVGIFRTNAAGDCEYVNRRWCEIAGMTLDQALGSGWAAAIHPGDRKRVRDGWYRAAEKRQPFNLEYRFRRPDGSVTWVTGNALAETGPHGEVTGYVGTITDLTDVKLGETVLRESEERYRRVVEITPSPIILRDGEHVVLANPAALRFFGAQTEDQLVGRRYFDLVHADQREDVRTRMHSIDRDQIKTHTIVRKFLRLDGQVAYGESSGAPFPYLNGMLGIITIHDVTKRISAEMALRESEERFRATFEQAAVGMALRDIDPRKSRWLRVNQKLCDILGYTEAELLQLTSVDVTPPGERDLAIDYNERMLRGEITSYSREKRYMRKDGSTIWVNLSVTAVRGPDRNPTHVISVIQDITERKEAEDSIKRLNRVYAVLSGINTLIVRVRDRQELFNEACRIAVEHGGFGMAWIGTFNQEKHDVTPVAAAGLEDNDQLKYGKLIIGSGVAQSQGVVARAMRQRQPVICNDITVDPEAGGERRKEAIRRGYRSVIAMPLMAESEVVGNFSLFAREPDFFNDDELKLLTELAGDISVALENISKREKLEKLTRIRAVSSEINAAIVRTNEREALLKETCRIAVVNGKFELVWIGLIDEENRQIQPIAWAGFSPEIAHKIGWPNLSVPGVTLGEVIQTRRLAVRNDIEVESAVGILRQEALRRGSLSTVCLPFLVDGKVVAAAILFATGRGFFDTDEIALLTEVANDVSFALEHIGKSEKLNYLAYYDALTGLPNRTLLEDHLGRVVRRARAEGSKAAVLMCDVKRFRHINETFGRQAGDELLRALGARLQRLWPAADNLGHIGAGCFAGVLVNVKDAAEIAHLIEKPLADALSLPFEIEGRELRVAVTAGIALFPEDGEDTDALLRNAEAALKKAKSAGERYLFYHPQMNEAVAETLLLESKLRKALEAEQFVLHYQPKIDLAHDTICGFEALIRWNDPETGLVPPLQFIPLLEETGMIIEVGRWAINKALQDYREWYAQGLQPPRIAVNVSPVQLRQKEFVADVREAIMGSAPHGVDLEITESLIMEDIAGSIEKLGAVRDLGVNIAIDDFGTGYSSLSYLAKLPVNALKIDRSFIITMADNPDSMTIVSTMISLAHSLNLKVIAEGVDSEDQRKFLTLLKCDEIQGYLVSRPVPSTEIVALLAERRATASATSSTAREQFS